MGGGAVHHDTGLAAFCAAFAELCPIRSKVKALRGKEFSVTGPCDLDFVRIRVRVRSRNRTTAHKRVGAAGNLVDTDRSAKAHLGIRGNGKAPDKVVETLIALGYNPYVVVCCKVLVLDDGINIITNIVVAARAAKGSLAVYAYGSSDAHGMDVTVADSPDFRTSCVDRSDVAGRSHFRCSIVIHTVDSDARCSSYCCPYIHSAPGAHGVDLAPGICRDADGRMIVCISFINNCIVQGSPAVFINIGYGSSSLKVEEILSPLHTETSPHADNA